LAFTVRPFFYQTGWFGALMALGTVTGIVGLYRTRVRHTRRQVSVLAGLVEERTRALQQEIGERRRSEDALRESHQRFEVVTRATSEIIWDRNMLTSEVWRNENFQTVLGYG